MKRVRAVLVEIIRFFVRRVTDIDYAEKYGGLPRGHRVAYLDCYQPWTGVTALVGLHWLVRRWYYRPRIRGILARLGCWSADPGHLLESGHWMKPWSARGREQRRLYGYRWWRKISGYDRAVAKHKAECEKRDRELMERIGSAHGKWIEETKKEYEQRVWAVPDTTRMPE